MFVDEFEKTYVYQYIYENKDKIPIIDTVKINDFLFGRFDIIINRYYHDKMEYLPLLLDFNNITNPIDINIGKLIDIPDFDWVIQNLKKCNIFDDNIIPGINTSMNNQEVNNIQLSENTKSKTTAIPKLKITQKNVSYDKETGIITY